MLLAVGCETDPTGEENNGVDNSGYGPGEGQITLQLGSKGFTEDSRAVMDGTTIKWEADDAIVINRKTYYVSMSNGKAVVYVDKAEDDRYEAFYPALLYDKANKNFSLPFAQIYHEASFGANAMPMYGLCEGGKKLDMQALCGVIRLNVQGEGYITSLYLEDLAAGAIAGEYKFNAEKMAITPEDVKSVSSSWLTLNCAGKYETGAALSSNGTTFHIVVPVGSYSSGLKLRISDRNHKKVEKIFTNQFIFQY